MSSVIDPTGAIGLTATEREPAAAPARGPGTAPEPVVASVIFALTPAQAVPDLYDYGKAKDAKIYKAATDPLTTKHNGTITTLRPMLDELLMRVKDFNWTSLVEIHDNNRKTFNVILQNRALTVDNVTASAAYLGTQTRAAQDNYLMVQCILNSLDTDGAKALRSSQYSYLVNGEACGALLIKVLFLDCEVETAATNFFVRAQLGDLEQHMVAIEYDVLEFNKHVSELLRKLRQGGEESNDDVLFIYMHVMRAYLICPDPDFLLAIKLQKLKAETDPKLLTLPILMITAQKAYQTLMQEGTYNSPQSHESRLIALAAKFGGAKTTDVSEAYSKSGRSKGKDKGKRAESWMTVAPKDNVITKVVEGKTYHYCPHHKRWGFHQEKDCFVKLKRLAEAANANSVTAPSSGASATSTQGSSDSSSRLTMSAAIAAVLNE